jgi:hypothetical protein
MRIDPNGTQTEIFGGDGFMTIIDPNNPLNIAEEYTNGVVSTTTNGGTSWSSVSPTGSGSTGNGGFPFLTQLTHDSLDVTHWAIGGYHVYKNTGGWSTSWADAVDLRTLATPPSYFDAGDATKRQVSALSYHNGHLYAGFCGKCDTVTQGLPFHNGIATDLGGTWHMPLRIGLPSRFISSIYEDPSDPSGNTILATLAGYGRHWAYPGAFGDDTSKIGTGHVFRSTDGGAHFTDISVNLPDIPADAVTLHGSQLVVGTDIGTFISPASDGSAPFFLLGTGMPSVPISHLDWAPNNPDLMVVATNGRGVYTYNFAAQPNSTVPDMGQFPALALVVGALVALAAPLMRRRRRAVA